MFPLGAVFVLLGYSGMVVAVSRLRGDNRTVTGILNGANGGQILTAQDTGGLTAAQVTTAVQGATAGTKDTTAQKQNLTNLLSNPKSYHP